MLRATYGPSQELSSWKVSSSNSMISREMKSHTNEHTVRGRPTLKVAKRFRKGSVCKAYERSTIYERTSWVNQESCCAEGARNQPGLSTLHLDKKHLRSVIVFSDVTVNQVGSQHELLTSVQEEKKGKRICFCCNRGMFLVTEVCGFSKMKPI